MPGSYGSPAGERPPLNGIRILSLAEQYPGPFATLVLSDLGADVVLVERPDGGDPARQFGPFFEALNRNKRSITLDLKTEKGRAAFLHLARTADVVLEGFRPGVAARLGVDHSSLIRQNERLVYVSISGFGQTGPYRDRPGHDLTYQGIAGALFDRVKDGDPGQPPFIAIGDLSAGTFAAVAVLIGLFQREQTGRGSYIDLSMTDGMVSWMATALVPVINALGPPGFPHEPGYAMYRTRDGLLLTLSVAHEDWFWRPLCHLVGMDQFAELTAGERLDRREELRSRLEAAIAQRPRTEWIDLLAEAGVPSGPVYELDEVAEDPHIRARGLLVEVPAADGRPGRFYVRQPLCIDGLGPGPVRHAPYLGEHTREVLVEAGYSDQETTDILTTATLLGAPVAEPERTEVV